MKTYTKSRIRLAGFIACGACLSLMILWGIIIRPTQNHIKTLHDNLTETKRKIEFSQRAVNNTDRMNADLEDSNQRLNQKENRGVASGDIYLWVVNLLLEMQTTNSVEFREFEQPRIGDLTMGPWIPYHAAMCRVRGIGRYHELGKFLANFENRYPLIRLLKLELEPASDFRVDPNLPGKLTIDMEFIVLVKPPKTNHLSSADSK